MRWAAASKQGRGRNEGCLHKTHAEDIVLGCLSSALALMFRASAFIVGYLCAGCGRVVLVQAGLEPSTNMSHLVSLNRGAKGW